MTSPHPPHQPPLAPVTTPNRRRWLLPALAGGAAVLFMCCIGTVAAVLSAGDGESGTAPIGAGREPSPSVGEADKSPAAVAEAEEEPEPEPEPVGFGPGIWEVGSEIPPGTYVTIAPAGGVFDSCYWARLSGFSGDFEELISNDSLDAGARGRLTISDRDAGVEFSGDCRWVEVSDAEPVGVGDEVGDGVWAVGDEIAPGTYTTTAPDGDVFDSCYWARLSGFSGDFDELLTNGIIDAGARGRVEIQASDAGVKFSGGCTWSRS